MTLVDLARREVDPLSVVVQLELGPGDPISGRVIEPDGRELSFSGWLALIGAIDGARSPEAGEERS